MDNHGNAIETKPALRATDHNAQELIRDWELLFWGFLLYGLARLAWLYLRHQDNSAFQLGVACGFAFCGALGFLMRWVLRPSTKGR